VSGWPTVLRPGDWVTFDGDEHQVVAIAGVSVRLRSATGEEAVVLATHLMGSPGFGVIDGEPLPQLSPFGLLDSLADDVVDAAKRWERHIVEVATGLPPDAPDGALPCPEYDPATRTLSDRETAKAAELAAAGRPVAVRTLQRLRARYGQQGLWGLIDQRATREWETTGRVDARVVAAVRDTLAAETSTSTGTRSRLIRRVSKALEESYGRARCRCRPGRRSTS
jgi:putative transposase